MNLSLDYMNEDHAKQICKWKYDGDYSIYNYPEWDIIVREKWAITIEQKRQNEFIALVNEFNDLCGFIRLINNSDCVFVGLGLKPSLCGHGLGINMMDLLKNECNKRFGDKKISLEVRPFNERALKCYKKAGFKVVDIYDKDTPIGHDIFILMEFSYQLAFFYIAQEGVQYFDLTEPNEITILVHRIS